MSIRKVFIASSVTVRTSDSVCAAFGLRMRHGTVTLRRLGDQDDGFPVEAYLKSKNDNGGQDVKEGKDETRPYLPGL